MKRRSYTSDEGWLLSYADLITNLLVFFAMLLAAAEISRSKMQQITEGISGIEQPESLSSIQEQINARIEAEGLTELVSTDLTDEGLKLSLNSGLVFDSGSAHIRTEQEPVLNGMLQTLAPFSGRYDFAVEGHTDSTPVLAGGTYASNWELSTARAISVVRFLIEKGIPPTNLAATGFGEYQPVDPRDTAVAHSRNRRIELKLTQR